MSSEMRRWTVGGALVLGDEGLLLVRNARRDGRHDWTPPGGVIEPGEPLLEGLGREVTEETGLVVQRWSTDPVYRVAVEAPELGWTLSVEVYLAESWEGPLRTGDDPDGIVVEATFVGVRDCAERLAGSEQWVREPITTWLDAGGDPDRPQNFCYDVTGSRRSALRVLRR